MKPRHGQVAAVVGSVRPAMSISRDKAGAADFFVIFFADRLPGDDGFDELRRSLSAFSACLMRATSRSAAVWIWRGGSVRQTTTRSSASGSFLSLRASSGRARA